MDKNELTKTELWTKRIQDFHENGLSQKEWCQEHQIPQSTFGYWRAVDKPLAKKICI